MKTCSKCGSQNQDNANFCGKCGASLTDATTVNKEQVGTSFFERINEYVGNENPTDLNWKALFSDVFRKHTKEEAEQIFICGTKTTTPSLYDVSSCWPRPWLYSRVLFMFVVAFVLLYVCCATFGNVNTLPGLIVVGSFTVPLSTIILFLEVNAYRNVSIYEVGQVFLIGGCASLVATLFLFSIIGDYGELDFIGALIVGVIEEIGKAVIVYHFINHIGKKDILPALLIGAAVGAGFAAFESAGYAMVLFLNAGADVMLDTIFLRGLLAPGGHVAWAAISGAALVIASKKIGEYSINIVTDKSFLRLFAIPVVLHALWDSPLSELGAEILLVPILLTIFVWVVVLILVNMGLAEIPSKKMNDEHQQ